MADRPQDDFDNEPKEVDTLRAAKQGLGVGARELAAIGESGEKGTLESGKVEKIKNPTIESDIGRSTSVLDRK